MRYSTVRWFCLILAVVLLTGCGSMRYASTLKPSGEKDLSLGGAKFHLLSVELEKKNDIRDNIEHHELDLTVIAQAAKELYPNLFSDEWTALPLQVRLEATFESPFPIGAILSAFTVGVIPVPSTAETKAVSVRTDLRGAEGEKLAGKTIDFQQEMVVWVSLIGPLGALPVPGESDLPRATVFLMIPLNADSSIDGSKEIKAANDYLTACVVEAIVQALRQVDPGLLAQAVRARAARLQQVSVDGRQCWSFLAPTFSGSLKDQEQADLFTAVFYQDYPKRDAKPLDSVIVARRSPDGRWQPVTGYLRSAAQLTSASVLLQDGKPSRVVLRQVEEPSLEDFLATEVKSGPGGASELRWSNNILLEAKNRTLPRVLREKSGGELLALATRIEKYILDLSEQSERAKDRAQGMVEKGNGDPDPERELAILCRQRIEVLKPILAALKQGAAVR